METYNVAEADRTLINKRLDALITAIEDQPKGMKWKMRARIGTKKKWYNEVEEVERATHLIQGNGNNMGDAALN
jgi:hypothetical protein